MSVHRASYSIVDRIKYLHVTQFVFELIYGFSDISDTG
jgi:hypothetical protein